MINSNKLHSSQKKALQDTVKNNFKSGVYFHATGTGKSWISLELIMLYNKLNHNHNVIWLCEKKSILNEQFNKITINNKGYQEIFNTFFIINFSENKPQDWFSRVNNASFWNKPILLIINRAFLVSKEKYKDIKIKIDVIIHDECHSIKNKTTQDFYNFMINKNSDIKCLGFSATPCFDFEPFKTTISKYTIYDAFKDKVILPPKIVWVKSDNELTHTDIIQICKMNIENLYYKKIIIWCGMIENCYYLSKLWSSIFKDFNVYIDTSKDNDVDFNYFSNANKNSILFCASKHREGSDIKNLDCCVFLDGVENRNSGTFIQCMGRILRKNINKKYGLIIDLKATSCIKICDRMNKYLDCNTGFPWKYNYKKININSKSFTIHTLDLIEPDLKQDININYTISDIINNFIIKIPNDLIYSNRLKLELDIIYKKNLSNYLMRAVDILKLCNFIPHVTRGSCGSSLVCFLLGISNVDPIKEHISFARFLNDFRETLPDIDFDFPHILRDEVFLQLELKWPNQVARISNHVEWKDKSSTREALRQLGIRNHIPKKNLKHYVNNLNQQQKKQFKEYKNKLENKFRHYSLHCGGIVFFHTGIPENLIINKKILSQIIYNKKDISKTNNFKIDILSSRAISQLIEICGFNINFNDCPYDEKTYHLLQSGDNIGITLAESPLMKKALLKIKPKSIKDIAICLALIRPAAKDTRVEVNDIDYNTQFIFDDDAIHILSDKLQIDEGLADKYRRCLTKNSWDKDDKNHFTTMCNKLNNLDKKIIEKITSNLRLYSFCKAHAYSYAQLVYKLAYQKAHNPYNFWNATLKYACSSYRKWVHYKEAYKAGVLINHKNSNIKVDNLDTSIYSSSKKQNFYNLTLENQIKNFGYWDMKLNTFYPNCYFYPKNNEYYFNGIIATMRVINFKNNVIVCFLGISFDSYIEVLVKNKKFTDKVIGVKGRATLKNKTEQTYVAHIAYFY